MSILPVLSAVPQEVVLNQAYNTPACECDDVPSECRLYQRRSLDELPAQWWDDERDHRDYEHCLERLYVQGLRAVRLA